MPVIGHIGFFRGLKKIKAGTVGLAHTLTKRRGKRQKSFQKKWRQKNPADFCLKGFLPSYIFTRGYFCDIIIL